MTYKTIMQQQAGSRYIGRMKRGNLVKTSHYNDREAFLRAIETENKYQTEDSKWEELTQ